MHISNETTLFMQKAIYYVSKPIAARGMLELTDRRLLFQVFPFDASFGIRNLSIELTAVVGVDLSTGDIHPRVIIDTSDRRHEFMLPKGHELYERLRPLVSVAPPPRGTAPEGRETACACGKAVNAGFAYCPWCGSRLHRV